MNLAARIAGLGFVGPGLATWDAAREALRTPDDYAIARTVVPVPDSLPPVERRRCGINVRVALAVGFEAARRAGLAPDAFATVFASSSSDGENCHAICAALASEDRLISPTRFHNSVHNAPSGYWSIAARATRASDSVCAFDASFGAGLLEALARVACGEAPVLLVAYDAPYPEPLHTARPIADAFAVAFALLPPESGTGPRIAASIGRGVATTLGTTAFERLRLGIPTARALPLLALLAREETGTAVIDYLPGCVLRVEMTP